jgi:sarcosine oxidase subunit beta
MAECEKALRCRGCRIQELTNEEILEMVPVLDLHEFWPVKRPEDPAFLG